MLGPTGQRGSIMESFAYWSAYVIGIYEMETATECLDNDPDSEVASTGGNWPAEPEWSAIPMEVIRDVASQHQWTQDQTNAVKRSIVVHEVGHQFELDDDDVSQHTNVMCGYTTDVPGERDQYLEPIVFLESHVYTIRTTLFP